MKVIRSIYCLFVMARVIACFSGEIVYQDYLAESELLTAQDQRVDAMVNVAFDWNCFFKSNSLAVALKIKYGYGQEDESNPAFRPIVVRYDFDSHRGQIGKSICRADVCYPGAIPMGFCMVGLDSFLFSYGTRQYPKTAFMRLTELTNNVTDVSHIIKGGMLHGPLSTLERSVFPNGGGYAFQCIGDSHDWNLLFWNNDKGYLYPIPFQMRGYVCLSGRRVLIDAPKDNKKDKNLNRIPLVAQCHHVLSSCDRSATINDYAKWGFALSNNVISLEKKSLSKIDWRIELHGMKCGSSSNDCGHEFAEGQGVLYDFFRWNIFRLRRNDFNWEVFNLSEFFRNDIDAFGNLITIPILHRGLESWYYAVLFESKKLNADEKCRYRMRIVEISREREQFFVWTFPDFKTNKKLATHSLQSPGVVYKLHDDSWVFVSNTMTFTNDFIFVQRMTGSKNEIKPIFKEMALEY